MTFLTWIIIVFIAWKLLVSPVLARIQSNNRKQNIKQPRTKTSAENNKPTVGEYVDYEEIK